MLCVYLLNQTCKTNKVVNFTSAARSPREAKSMHRQNPQRRIESVGERNGLLGRGSYEAAERKGGKNATLKGPGEAGGGCEPARGGMEGKLVL